MTFSVSSVTSVARCFPVGRSRLWALTSLGATLTSASQDQAARGSGKAVKDRRGAAAVTGSGAPPTARKPLFSFWSAELPNRAGRPGHRESYSRAGSQKTDPGPCDSLAPRAGET